jgi:23S rRNA pseudouridine2605 synthase
MGRNRIVRRLLAAAGHPVIELTRTAFGPLHIGSLSSGAMRDLTRDELGALFDTVDPVQPVAPRRDEDDDEDDDA